MTITPEAQAWATIDTLLVAAGWAVQEMACFNRHAAEGVAVRKFPLPGGSCDCVLLAHPAARFTEVSAQTALGRARKAPA